MNRLLAASLALLPVPLHAQSVEHWAPFIDEAAIRFGVPSAWVRKVMSIESAGRTRLAGHLITSSAGALGLMQLMPGTWAEMRLRHGLGADPHDPHDNILAGTAYLRAMYDQFGYPGLFAAYNAGPGRYAEHLAYGRDLPAETRLYVSKLIDRPRLSVQIVTPIMVDLRRSKANFSPIIRAQNPAFSPLFVVLRTTEPPAQ